MANLKNVHTENYTSAIEQLNLEGEFKGDEFCCLCVFHKEKTPSMFINIHTGKFYCFGCGEGGPFSKLAKYLNQEIDESEFRASPAIIESPKNYFCKKIKDTLTIKRRVMREGALDKITHECMDKSLAYFKGRGLTSGTLRWFEVRDGAGMYEGRAVIPIKDVDGTLLSVIARSYTINDQRFKARKVPDSEAKATLFGLYQLDISMRPDMLILVEGEIDAMSGQQCGYPTVAMMGLSVTDKQLTLMSYYQVVLFLDKGVSKEIGNKLMKKISTVTDVRRLEAKNYKDLNDALHYGGTRGVHKELQSYKKLFRKEI